MSPAPGPGGFEDRGGGGPAGTDGGADVRDQTAGCASGGDVGEGTARWRMTVAYDGSNFHGFAAQRDQATVAGALAEALGRVVGVAGRPDLCRPDRRRACTPSTRWSTSTSRGERSASLDPATVVSSCNSQLGPAVVVRDAEVAPDGFDARHSATARRYRYLVVNAPVADPLLAGTGLARGRPARPAGPGRRLRRPARGARLPGLLPAGAGHLPRRPDPPAGDRGQVDRVELAAVEREVPGAARRATPVAGSTPALVPAVGRLLAFEIEANAFCHQMVRSLVGTLVDVGRGRKRPSDILWILRAADRQQAAQPAPPWGLTLMDVRYDPDRLA